ncbi:MAG: hypothetical protein O3B13_17030 [Planctomycetota bacterium]|nr:hypothetical protein [Planctomycetota bacterium]MDA1164799.1 hypothetical protein [Planctomycetota bacterium]
MSDNSESTRPDEKQSGMPPVFLVAGFLVMATAGSVFVILPAGQQAATVSSSMVLPVGDSLPLANSEVAGHGGIAGHVITPDESHVAQNPAEERLNRLIVGTWRQNYFGERTLSVTADGTAAMTIVPDSVWAFAFGPRIDLNMFWSIKDGHLDYGVSGGTPAEKVRMASTTWGDHWIEKIILLDENKLDLLSVDGVTHSIWERVSVKPEAAVEPDNE